jgi:hypothetical protein
MMKSGLCRKMKTATLAILIAGGTLLGGGCSLQAVRDSLWDGVLDAVEGASSNAVDSLIINLNEIFESTPDNAIDTP